MKKLIFILILFVLSLNAFAQTAEVSSRLRSKMNTMSPLEYVPVLILLRDRVDVETLDRQLYQVNANAQYRAKSVIEALMTKAQNTQGPLLGYLNSMNSAGKVRLIESYWITNLILVDANIEVLNELKTRADVDMMDLDAELDYDRPLYPPLPAAGFTEAAEVGLKVIQANKLWEIGITGAGRLVMNIDTGVDITHPALNSRWRGNNGSPWYHAWFDKYASTTQPADCDGHGTHTMGIMCGRAGSDTVGVAPNAQWIAARTICSSPHTSNSIAAFQWAMNPDSNASTSSDMPDAIGNSWYDPDVTNECSGIYKTTLDALEAAGIAVVFSCGNNGPGASTITKPKNINTNLVNVFSVGNINGNIAFPYAIASSSSRGPSACGGTGSLLIKPEVVAPGTSVRSSYPGGGYSSLTGTSMACPHIVGAVALLKQVAPNMTGKQLLEALYNTAVQLPVGGVENNDYGKGVIDVFAAYQSLGPNIVHTSLPNTENLAGPYPVTASISSVLAGINHSSVKLFWSRNSTTFSDSILMTYNSGTNWSANIPGNGTVATYRYYITATDSLGRKGTNPPGAPAYYNTFVASPDTTKPVITHTPIVSYPRLTWPATVNSTVTDNFGVDSVWVKWYKNTTATGIKRFNLAKGTGNAWSGMFNSDTTQIAIGDSIFYRIFARDVSMAHNSDSTSLYKFTIINQVTTTIGTGTTSSNFPFTTYWMDGRTQYLYLASELNMPSGYIAKIGFDIITAQTQVMNEFTISCQNTTATSLTGFVNTGWTVAHGPVGYTTPGTGWQMIELSQPFYYNAGSNLLIDICYNNSSYTQYSTVNSTAAAGMLWGRYGDLSSASGCGYTAWTLTTAPPGRANTRFVMNPGPTGVENQISGTPLKYRLSQNYPNPFNPVTKINYSIPKQELVILKVYDILGREVRTLVNEVKNAGSFTVDFDGKELASGAYFYRLQSGDFFEIKKMLLIK